MSTRVRLLTVGEISAMLAGRIQTLARELLPNGKQEGHEWRVGSLAGEEGRSLAVHLSGRKAGVFADFSTGETGDALDLVAQVLFNGDMKRAVEWAKRWLGLEDASPDELATARRVADGRVGKIIKETDESRNAALRIWLGAEAEIKGTPVEDYLAERCIELPTLGRSPHALRYHPGLWCEEVRVKLPAMVAAISGARGFLAVHRTWLEKFGPGDWRKARLRQPKKVLGSYAGGTIRLWRGASGKSLANAPEGEQVDVAEGIEDALSIACGLPESRVLAAVSLANLGGIELPKQITRVALWKQNDTEPQAVRQFDRAVAQLQRRNLDVEICQVPLEYKDINDAICGITR